MVSANAERKGKPRRLFNAEKSKQRGAKCATVNDFDSPFLRITPEIRNTIYALVLGGNEIHIHTLRFLDHRICTASAPTKTSASDDEGPSVTDALKAKHRYCHDRRLNTSRLDLSLLCVSKQIHAEAALLPFMLNTFIFGYVGDIGEFAARLIVSQRAAIQSIVLLHRVGYYNLSDTTIITRKADIAKLTGLKDLAYIAETKNARSPELHQVKPLLKEIELAFARQSLSSVSICVKALVGNEYQHWARETEQALLVPWDEEAHNATVQRELEEKARERKVAEQARHDSRAQRGLRRMKFRDCSA